MSNSHLAAPGASKSGEPIYLVTPEGKLGASRVLLDRETARPRSGPKFKTADRAPAQIYDRGPRRGRFSRPRDRAPAQMHDRGPRSR